MNRSKLRDLTLHITDGEHATVKDTPNSPYYLLSNKNIVNGDIVITKKDRTISKTILDKINHRTQLDKGDIVISTVGTIGKVALIKEKPSFEFQRSVGIIKCNTDLLSPEYLMYYLNLPCVQNRLKILSKGAIQKCLFINDLEDFIIDYPESIEEQKSLVKSLINIDNQIERNNAMIQKLQDMILTRYSIMFQDKTNRNGLLKDICLLPSGHNFKPEIYNNYGKYKLITIKNVCDTFVDDINTDKISEVPNIKDYCYLNIGDILLSLTGNVGRISIVHSKNNLLNQRVSLLQAKENYKIYSYCLLKSQEYQFIMTNIARGTSQKNLSPIDVENLQIYMPTFEEIKAFNENTENYFNEMLIIKQSTESLIKLKNTLLPLLINGQLSV